MHTVAKSEELGNQDHNLGWGERLVSVADSWPDLKSLWVCMRSLGLRLSP